MNCKEFLERLDAYIDGEMAQPERQAFLGHAQDCSTCREELRCAEAIREALLLWTKAWACLSRRRPVGATLSSTKAVGARRACSTAPFLR